MKIINHLNQHFSDFDTLNTEFVGNPPFPLIVLDNFLPKDTALSLYQESKNIQTEHWKTFSRNNSLMYECNKLAHASNAFQFVNEMQSGLGMQWITKMTGIKDLIPDPYLTGAGYSKIPADASLKVHTDFNWNDELKLHRMLSFIVYLTPDWEDNYGGNLKFYDFKKEKVIQDIVPKFNRAVFWRYHKKGFHGCPGPVNCPKDIDRTSFRLFFYTSNAVYNDNDRPHRSLYWYDKDLDEPYDIPSQK